MIQDPITNRALDLLGTAKRINHYESILTAANGENFNIFNILKSGHYEVKTHSPILAELLNPQGCHGQGPTFLKLFVEKLRTEQNADHPQFDTDSAIVKMEHYIGRKTDDEGGRIDIILWDKNNNRIIIENKIYANEQPNQLKRYQNQYPNAFLIYLTLTGEESQDKDNVTVSNLSYKEDIIQWLEACRKEASQLPVLRETITQYINLIKQLTNQNTNSRMTKELTDAVLDNESNFRAYQTLRNAESSIRTQIFKKLEKDLEDWTSLCELTLHFGEHDLSKPYDGFYFTNPQMDEAKVRITFQFQGRGNTGCLFGYARSGENVKGSQEARLIKAFRDTFPYLGSENPWWVARAWWDNHRSWDDDTLAAIQFGNFKDEIIEMVRRMLKAFEESKQG